jgi:transposase
VEQKHYKRDLKELEARRRRGMRLLQRGMSQAAVARELGVSRQTVSSWNRALQEGAEAWRRKTLGRPAGLSPTDKRALLRRLKAGPRANGFAKATWTLASVGQLIAREFGRTYSNVHVMRLLRAMDYAWQPAAGDGEVEPKRGAARPWRGERNAVAGEVGEPA